MDLSFVFFFKQKTAYDMRISYWSSDVCSSDLVLLLPDRGDRDLDLVGRGNRRVQARHLPGGRRRALGAHLQQDGDRQRQDHGDGDGHHLAGPERAGVSQAQQGLLEGSVHRGAGPRSEEHTSELQSLMRISYAVFCLTQKQTSPHKYTILTTMNTT